MSFSKTSIKEGMKSKWFPLAKGGEFRKWYGNNDYLINYYNNGESLIKNKANLRSKSKYFTGGCTWTVVSSGGFAVRYLPEGFLFDQGGSGIFCENEAITEFSILGSLNSNIVAKVASILCPTLNFTTGDVRKFPVWSVEEVAKASEELVDLSRIDWDFFETSWNFSVLHLFKDNVFDFGVQKSFKRLRAYFFDIISKTMELEKKNNYFFIDSYNLGNELTPEVPLDEITLTCNPHYRYGGNRSEEELETLLQCDTLKELVSYTIGCMMGRYSLDKPGLILASQGETVRDYLAQISEPSFAPDDNAIIPLTDQEWFPDDATNRFRDFVCTVWGEEHLQENLDFVAESLCLHAIKPKKGEAALDTIRRYLSTQFFKDHLRTYKKRPIYWLFSSGKQKAFECLVYLHRYNESTLAEMRTDYVIPLTTKLASYVEKIEQDKDASTSAAEAKAIEKELSKLYKQQAELNTFDEKLRHYADQRISLDLDDGVKVNYGKFGDLLAEVKQVVGK